MKKLILLALLLSSCSPYHKSTITPVDSKIVTNVIEFVTSPWWRGSGYSRLTDVETPFKIVIAGDDTVCPIYTLDVEPIRKNEPFHCPTKWLIKQ